MVQISKGKERVYPGHSSIQVMIIKNIRNLPVGCYSMKRSLVLMYWALVAPQSCLNFKDSFQVSFSVHFSIACFFDAFYLKHSSDNKPLVPSAEKRCEIRSATWWVLGSTIGTIVFIAFQIDVMNTNFFPRLIDKCRRNWKSPVP